MALYRKKPVVIEAVQYTENFTNTDPSVPEWFVSAVLGNVIEVTPRGLAIRTLEGEMAADVGDWIIRGVKGEIYPCKPDIFAATYSRADATEDAEIERERAARERAEKEVEMMRAALNDSPILSKYHTVGSFNLDAFINDYMLWRGQCRALLARQDAALTPLSADDATTQKGGGNGD